MSEQKSKYKKRGVGSFIGTTISIAILGIIIGLAGAFLGLATTPGFDGLATGLIGLIIGYPLGVIIGIIWANKIRHHYGSLLFGVIGTIMGALIAIALESPLNLNLDPTILFGTFFVIVPVLCVIGFYLKGQPKEIA